MKAAKKARTRSIPSEKLAGFGHIRSRLCQFTLELFGSPSQLG